MARYLLPPSHLVDPSRVLSATSERGSAVRLGPVADANNVGTLQLWAEHVDPEVMPVALALSMEGGGNPEGYIAGGPTVTAGARLNWKLNSEPDASLRGWVDRPFCEYLDRPAYRTATETHGRPSHLRTCHDGRVGFVAYRDGSPSDALIWRYKTDSRDDWAEVVIHGGGLSPVPELTDPSGQPGLLITDAGRLIAYGRVLSPFGASTGFFVAAWYSDDHGATWAILNDAAASLLNASSILNAEWVGGSAMLICGKIADAAVDCYNSTSDGISFTPSGVGNATLYRPRTTIYNGVVMIHADDDAGAVYQQTVSPGGNVDDGDAWTEIPTSQILHSNDNKQRAITTDDQGDLWVATVVEDNYAQTLLYYSSNGGALWVQAGQTTQGTAVVGLDVGGVLTGHTWEGLSAGMMGGSLVLLGRTNGGVSSTDGHILAAYLGGWNRTFSEEVYSEYAGDSYGYHYLPFADPVSFGWTKTNTGAGATVAMTATGWQITGSPTVASDYQAPGNWRSAMNVVDGVRVRAVTNHSAVVAGNTNNARCRLRVQKDITGGSQWVELRFSRDKIAAYDSTGMLFTTGGSVGSNDFVGFFEYLVVLNAAPTSGLCTIYYRKVADGVAAAWTTLIADQAIVTDGATSGDDLRIGGAVSGNSDLYLRWIAMATDGYGIREGAASRGRALSNSGAMYLDAGLAVGAYGTGAVAGDTYTLTQVSAFPKEALWTFPSPSEQCQSINDSSIWRVVFDAGPAGLWRPDMVQLFGTNFKDALVQFNAADSWGSPTYSTAVSATIRTASIDSAELGGVALDILPEVEMTPHEFASKPGRRYFLHFSGSGTVYEITDNSETFLFVEGANLSSEVGTVSIYADSMWVGLPNSSRRYMAITVPVQDTADEHFSLGYVLPGAKVTMNAGDGSDAAWGWNRGTRIPVKVEKAADGYSSPTLIGGPQKLLMLPMLPSLIAVRDWHGEVAALHRYINGPGGVVGVVLNNATPHMHNNGGLYRLTGDTVKQVNVYGDQDELERVRVTALNLEEVV